MIRTSLLLILLGLAASAAAPAMAQRDMPAPQQSASYDTACVIESYPSWCHVVRGTHGPQSLMVEFAHGDKPTITLVPITSSRDPWGALQMRELNTGVLWTHNHVGYDQLIEQNAFGTTVCIGEGSRQPYPRGCAKP